MNKTLLLIICDFMLLNLLALTHWEKAEPTRLPTHARPVAVAGADGPTAETNLVAAMKLSLADEQTRREQAARQLQLNEQESSRLATTLAETQQDAASFEQKLAAVTQDDSGAKVRLEQLQHDLEAREAEAARQQARLAALEQQQAESGRKIESLNVTVKAAEQEKEVLRENIDTLQRQVMVESAGRQKAQETTAQLAQGVGRLADKSGELTQEIRDNRPVNANTLYSEFLANRVQAVFTAARPGLLGTYTRDSDAPTVLVSDGRATYALLHIDATPFSLRESNVNWTQLLVELRRDGTHAAAEAVTFLARDPRLVALPVDETQATALGAKVYRTAADPFKFPDAVLISNDGSGYGEVPFKLDEDNPGYVRMDNRLLRRLFGDFSPSRGDLVLSHTGELLGIMVNRDYCVLADSFQPAQTLRPGPDLKSRPTSPQFEDLAARWHGLALPLQ